MNQEGTWLLWCRLGRSTWVHVQDSGESSCWLTGTGVCTKSWAFPKHFSTSPVGAGRQAGRVLCSIPSHPGQSSCSTDPCMAQPAPSLTLWDWCCKDFYLETCWFPQPLQGLESPLRAGKGVPGPELPLWPLAPRACLCSIWDARATCSVSYWGGFGITWCKWLNAHYWLFLII